MKGRGHKDFKHFFHIIIVLFRQIYNKKSIPPKFIFIFFHREDVSENLNGSEPFIMYMDPDVKTVGNKKPLVDTKGLKIFRK